MAGVLAYSLSLSTSAFTGPLGAATGAMRGLAGAAASAAGTLAKITAPLAALGGGIGLFKSLEKAANMESLSMSFETILGGAKEADAMLKKIVATASTTPYGIEELSKAARRLLAVTGRDELIPSLRMIGDVASASQVPIEELAGMFAKFKGMDVIQGEAFEQLSIALPGSLQKLAEVVGAKDVPALRQLGTEGRITGAALDALFVKLTSQGGMAFNAMNKQAGTTKGLLSNLSDAADKLMVALGTPINDFLKPIIEANSQRLEIFTTRFKAFLTLLQSARENGKLGEFVGQSLKVAMLETINIFSGGIRGTIAWLGSALPGIAQAFRDSLLLADSLLIVKNVFFGIGDYLESALLRGAEKLADATKKTIATTAAIAAGAVGWAWLAKGGADSLNGSSNFGSKAAASGSANHFRSVKNLLEDLDMAQGLTSTAKTLKKVYDDANAAYAAVYGKPLFDTTAITAQLKALSSGLNSQAAAQLFNTVLPGADPADTNKPSVKGPVLRASDKADKAAEAAKEKSAATLQQNLAGWAEETRLLAARATGRDSLIKLADREASIEKYKLELMDKQNLTADEALQTAKERVALEEKAAKGGEKTKGVLGAAASTAKRLERKAVQDEIRELRRTGQPIDKTAIQLRRAAAAADPNRARREAAARGDARDRTAAADEAAKLKLMQQMCNLLGSFESA